MEGASAVDGHSGACGVVIHRKVLRRGPYPPRCIFYRHLALGSHRGNSFPVFVIVVVSIYVTIECLESSKGSCLVFLGLGGRENISCSVGARDTMS